MLDLNFCSVGVDLIVPAMQLLNCTYRQESQQQCCTALLVPPARVVMLFTS